MRKFNRFAAYLEGLQDHIAHIGEARQVRKSSCLTGEKSCKRQNYNNRI